MWPESDPGKNTYPTKTASCEEGSLNQSQKNKYYNSGPVIIRQKPFISPFSSIMSMNSSRTDWISLLSIFFNNVLHSIRGNTAENLFAYHHYRSQSTSSHAAQAAE